MPFNIFGKHLPKLPDALLREITDYIEKHYAAEQETGSFAAKKSLRHQRARMDVCDSNADFGAPPPCASIAAPSAPSLEHWLQQTDAGFTETLLKLIDKTGKKDAEVYKKANISKQHFSKIRNNPDYRPTKSTAIAFAIALELDLEQTEDLIRRAGYALTNSSKFDLIICYFIRQKKYDIIEINIALYNFDQPLLGA